MKSMMKKKSILIAVLAVLLIGTGVAATLAYLSDKEEALVNTFKVGNVTTEIIEDIFKQETDTIFAKEPYVKNTGENDCYVRARVVCSPEEAFEELVINENWELNPSNPTDGFYYYVGNKGKEDGILLAPGEGVEEAATETEPIFTQVEIKGDMLDKIDGFEVTVYQEAVQTVVYRGNGDEEPIRDMYKIWEWYDNGGKEISSTDSENP